MILAFGHKAQTGKDTAGEHLVKWYGFKRVAFADRLKEICSLLGGIPIHYFYGENKNNYNSIWGMTHREMTQKLGTEAIRNNFNEDAWCIAALNNLDPKVNYVVTDMRFPNEVNYVKSIGGRTILIKRDTSAFTDINKSHMSETALDNYGEWWDYEIDNIGPLSVYLSTLDLLMLKLGFDKRTALEAFVKHTIPITIKKLWNYVKRRKS